MPGTVSPPGTPLSALTEGGANRNIKRINVVISNDTLFANYWAVARTPAAISSAAMRRSQLRPTFLALIRCPSNLDTSINGLVLGD